MGRRVHVCPKCGSTEIYYIAGMVTGQKYRCKRCGYIGSLIIETDEDDLEDWEAERIKNESGEHNARF
jgi:tRNA(Ile2) C34 agmatinyltransferase TiaS